MDPGQNTPSSKSTTGGVGDRKAKYLQTGRRHFAKHGFNGASLDAISKDVGVTKQAILHFFGSKERYYFAIIAELFERLTADLESRSDADPA